MKNRMKLADNYVTFIPTNEEFSLVGTAKGNAIFTSDKKYMEYDFEPVKNYRGQEYYQLVIDNINKLDKFSNCYKLYYEAIYQGEKFAVLFNSDSSTVTLRWNHGNEPDIEGFKRMDKFYWDKTVRISEIELVPVKTPIDLSKYLPQK